MDQLKKYKEGIRTLKREVTLLLDQVKKLNSASCQDEELMEANSIMTAKVASLWESMDKAKADAVEEYKDS